MFFTIEKIEKQLHEIRAYIHRERYDIARFKFIEGNPPGAESPDFDDHQWSDFSVGDQWGGYDMIAWFRAWMPIPEQLRDKKLVLHFLVGPRDGGGSSAESMLYVDGTPMQGLDEWHTQAWLPPEFACQERILVALKAWSGVLHVPERRRFQLAQLAWIDQGAERFFYLADTLVKSVKLLDEHDLRRVRLLELLNQSFLTIDFLKPGSEKFYRSQEDAFQSLSEGLVGLETLEIKPRVTAVGHAHLDLAWLWRLNHTREKAARTFTTALHLMRQYPEFHFVHSSPQLFQFLKQDFPQLYSRVKEKVAAGSWEVTGGMWVEADTNLPSGESLIRQFLYGRRFIKEEFGVDSDILWLPDVFGYSAALPQIARKSGMRYFMTTKISWNQFNRFPYDTFRWRGIDGTELLSHFVTTPDPSSWYETYNACLEPADVKGIWEQYRQKEVNDELLLLFGWGDGGGGPTVEMLETARGLRNLPGIPSVQLDKAEAYFQRLESRLAGKTLPGWDGELYLEYHRGTYTSQAENKRANRRAELLYHDAEWLSSLAVLLGQGYRYPAEALRKGWELILLNQFHDILPGSSIRQVYEDSRAQYQTITEIGEQALVQARSHLLDRMANQVDSLVVFNPLGWQRDALLCLPAVEALVGKTILDGAGKPAITQLIGEHGEQKILLEAEQVPGFGYQCYPLVSIGGNEPGAVAGMVVTAEVLENDWYRLELNQQGQLTSLQDKRLSREVLAPGERGNVFLAFEDKPMNFDAWDIDIYYQEKYREISELLEACVEEAGPLRGVLRLRWRFSDSEILQRLTIYRNSPRIDFRTEVDWYEHQVLLKVAFPVAVRSTRATYEVQFGSVERPTHWNTSWDYARFESVGHKWVDLSEGGYGVSLLNDCKYGHDVKNNVLRLTLIKSAIEPDSQADQGRHIFTYSLLPHEGDWRQSEVIRQAYALNDPVIHGLALANPQGSSPPGFSLAQIDSEHVIIETIKQAEAGDAWIVRLYEWKQSRSNQVRLTFGKPITRAVECNLVEEDEREVAYSGESLSFPILPFEIKTFKVWF